MGTIDIKRLEAEDAEKLISCFERCYGKTYPSDDFYSPDRLRARIQQGTLRSVVAMDKKGAESRLVGHTGLTVRPAVSGRVAARAAVAGNTVVDPEYRGKGVLDRMLVGLVDLTKAEGFVGYVHYPTTAHTIIQKRSVKRDGVETGIHLAYLPADTDYRSIDQGTGRLAATVVYQPFTEAPVREVRLPGRYRELLTSLYEQSGLQRGVLSRADRLPREAALSLLPDARMGVLRVEVSLCGADLAGRLEAAIEEHAQPVVHVDLFLDDPGVDQAVETLRSQEFLYCGLLPELAHTDVLRMQRLPPPSDDDPFQVKLANLGARKMLELMRRESKP